MAVTKVTDEATEGDLEARIDTALRLAFPLLPSGALTHQTTFSFKFGGKTITVDGEKRKAASARSDVLVEYSGKRLAVLELKRPGLPLSVEDNEQGLSYARVLFPSPPLVVVTNGLEFRLLETHTGQEWKPAERTDQTIANLIKNAALVATHDLKNAVGTLMGTNPDVWVQAVGQTSDAAIAELTGTWGARLLPFVEGFQIPRKATAVIKILIKKGEQRLLIVHGQPMSGKSNVLREFAQSSSSHGNAVLFIESDGETSILQQVADLLNEELDWPVSKDEARTWLRTIARGDGPILVLAIDGIGLNFDDLRDEISDLCSDSFGKKLSIVVELDSVIAERAVKSSDRRRLSKIGRKSAGVPVLPLDLSEFNEASRELWNHKIGISKGGHLSPEYRLPWVLRAVASYLVKPIDKTKSSYIRMIPSTLSLNLVTVTRKSFEGEHELRRRFQGVAKSLIDDALSDSRSIPLKLESISSFMVLRNTLENHLSNADVETLIEDGLLKPILHDSGEPILLVRMPELAASEVAHVLSKQLKKRADLEDFERAKWLCDVAAAIPFGDIVAAQAIIDNALNGNGLSIGMVERLLDGKVEIRNFEEGAEMAMDMPGIGVVQAKYCSDGLIVNDGRGGEHILRLNPGDGSDGAFSDINAWLILSHLGAIRMGAFEVGNEDEMLRVDPAILLEVGSCITVLRRPPVDPNMNGIHTHDFPGQISIVCHHEGVVEVITNSILQYLGSERSEDWIDLALSRDSMPLLARIDIALRQLATTSDAELSSFAQDMLDRKIRPAFSAGCAIPD